MNIITGLMLVATAFVAGFAFQNLRIADKFAECAGGGDTKNGTSFIAIGVLFKDAKPVGFICAESQMTVVSK